MWTRPRETSELMPIDVTVGDTKTTDFTVAVVEKYGDRPVSGFAPATVDDGQAGVIVTGLAPGDYWAFPRVGDAVLNPVWFRIT